MHAKRGNVGLTADSLDPGAYDCSHENSICDLLFVSGTHWHFAVSVTQVSSLHQGKMIILGQTKVLLQTHPDNHTLIMKEAEEALLSPASVTKTASYGWFKGEGAAVEAEVSPFEDSAVIVDSDVNSDPHHPNKMFRLIQADETRLHDLQTANSHLLPARQLLQLLNASGHMYQTLQQYGEELKRCYDVLIADCSKVMDISGASRSTLLAQQGGIGLTVEISQKILECSAELDSARMQQFLKGPIRFLTTVRAACVELRA